MSYAIDQFVAYLHREGFEAASSERTQWHQFYDKKLDEHVTIRVYLPLLKNDFFSASSGVRMYLYHEVLQRYVGETAYYEWTDEADLEDALKLRIEVFKGAYLSGQYRSPLNINGYVFKNGLQPYWVCRETGGTFTDEEWKAMQ